MREKPRDKERLIHILESCDLLLSKNIDEWKTVANDKIGYYGLVKIVEIIGEATYKLTKEFRSNHPETPWDIIEDMRHVLVHGYYQISMEHLLQTIEFNIRPLREQISIYLEEYE